eukprot:TRINITY_DN4488_c1_g1_i4.p1 TRINITY_DN4488_c1_g1~~TRINITY_DN4488_c1_g1_i4.p1  ORF type:complete len:620 (+),score=68.34 TRINITY_DN4488_c1_g1_i4:167-2026(+)
MVVGLAPCFIVAAVVIAEQTTKERVRFLPSFLAFLFPFQWVRRVPCAWQEFTTLPKLPAAAATEWSRQLDRRQSHLLRAFVVVFPVWTIAMFAICTMHSQISSGLSVCMAVMTVYLALRWHWTGRNAALASVFFLRWSAFSFDTFSAAFTLSSITIVNWGTDVPVFVGWVFLVAAILAVIGISAAVLYMQARSSFLGDWGSALRSLLVILPVLLVFTQFSIPAALIANEIDCSFAAYALALLRSKYGGTANEKLRFINLFLADEVEENCAQLAVPCRRLRRLCLSNRCSEDTMRFVRQSWPKLPMDTVDSELGEVVTIEGETDDEPKHAVYECPTCDALVVPCQGQDAWGTTGGLCETCARKCHRGHALRLKSLTTADRQHHHPNPVSTSAPEAAEARRKHPAGFCSCKRCDEPRHSETDAVSTAPVAAPPTSTGELDEPIHPLANLALPFFLLHAAYPFCAVYFHLHTMGPLHIVSVAGMGVSLLAFTVAAMTYLPVARTISRLQNACALLNHKSIKPALLATQSPSVSAGPRLVHAYFGLSMEERLWCTFRNTPPFLHEILSHVASFLDDCDFRVPLSHGVVWRTFGNGAAPKLVLGTNERSPTEKTRLLISSPLAL